MGFFDKLKNGLTKTKDAFFGQVNDVLKSFRRVDEDLLEELEELLICADMGAETAMSVVDELREKIKEDKITEADAVKDALKEILRDHIGEGEPLKLETTPSVILVIGVNGVGKTTSIGKISAHLKSQGKKVIVAAADTFRAAAVEQLQSWADRLNVPLYKGNPNQDPASVCYEAHTRALEDGVDYLICDTAGRLHNKANLMAELAKIRKVIAGQLPEADTEVLLVLDATTGQNAMNQACEFKKVADLTGVVLTKLDGTAKGGMAIPLKNEMGLPIRFIGVGEQMDDLQPFNGHDFAKALF
jgi:fused signal recognition particle receptor